MRHLLYRLLLVLAIALPSLANAQYQALGNDPNNLNWLQKENSYLKFIYPTTFTGSEDIITSIIDRNRLAVGNSLNHNPKRVEILIHSQSRTSNGFVSWAPKRIELFNMTSQSSTPSTWFERLVIHEYRHFVQLDKVSSEMPQFFKYILGEQPTPIISLGYMPMWFIEGDAVVAETGLTDGGRGRSPSFSAEIRAQIVEKGVKSYDKAYIGSFRDFTPDYYQVGYLYTALARANYGTDIWSNVISNVANRPYSFTPFTNELKRATGERKKRLYKTLFNNLRDSLSYEIDNKKLSQFNIKSPENREYTEYRYSQMIANGDIVALRLSNDHIDRFVQISNGEERRLITPGYVYEYSVDISDRYIVWIEDDVDIHWEYNNRTKLFVYDIETGKVKHYIYDKLLTAPAIKDNLVVVAETTDNHNSKLTVIDLISGKIVKSVKEKLNREIVTPSWNGANVVYIAQGLGRSIVETDLDGNFRELTKPESVAIISPVIHDNRLYYIRDIAGVEEIVVLDNKNDRLKQVTSSKFGVKDISFTNDGKILYSNYNSKGFHIAETGTDNPKSIDQSVSFMQRLANTLTEQELKIATNKSIDSCSYTTSSYKKGKNLFNFHSWAPVSFDPEDIDQFGIGATVMSQNLLSTAITTASVEFDPTTSTTKASGTFTYTGFKPDISSKVGYYTTKFKTVDDENRTVDIKLDRGYMQLSASLPLNFRYRGWSQKITPKISYAYFNDNYSYFTDQAVNFKQSNSMVQLSLSAYNIYRSTERDIQPRWGQVLNLETFTELISGDRYSSTAIEGYFYLPGVMKHHGISIYSGYQIMSGDEIVFSSTINLPRGFENTYSKETLSLRSDYTLPLLYPDLSLGAFYLKRIYIKGFYDLLYLGNNDFKNSYFGSTYGGEIHFNLYPLSHLLNTDFGIRTSFNSIDSEPDIAFSLKFAI